MITLDTSALLSLLNRRDPDYKRLVRVMSEQPGPYIVPMGALAEIVYMVERRLGGGVLEVFLSDLEDGGYTLECGEEDLPRARALVSRYRDLPLDLTDALVIACAERNGGAVLTLDHRHFGMVAKEGLIRVQPE